MKTRRFIWAICALLIGVFLLSSCGQKEPKPNPKPEPEPEPPVEVPVIHNLTDSGNSDVVVHDYDYNSGKLEIETPENEIPQIGDIVCSGRTEEAPYGFLFEVEEVKVGSSTKADDGTVKKTVTLVAASVSLYTLFQKLGISCKEWIPLIESDASFSDDAGHTITPIRTEDNSKVFSLEVPIKVSDDIEVKFSHELSVPLCAIYLDTETPNVVAGFDVMFKNTDLIHIKAKSKMFERKGDLGKELALKDPTIIRFHDIQIGPVPIVITTKYKPTLPYELSLSANLDMDVYKKVSFHHIGGYYHLMTNSFTPLENSSDFFEVIDGTDDGEDGSLYSDREFSATLEGRASFGVDFEFSAGLYGGNLLDNKDLNYLTVGANAGVKLEDKMSLGGLMNLDEMSHNAVRVVDDNKFTSYLYGKIWGTALSANVLGANVEVLSGEKEWKFLKTEYHLPFFFPYYSKLKVNSITNQGFINVSATRHESLFGGVLKLFKEESYGLCLESADGDDYQMFDLTDHPIDKDTGEFSYDVPLSINKLRRNVKYSIYPYSKVANFLLTGKEKVVCRSGISFTISDDGQISTAIIDEVPGEQL